MPPIVRLNKYIYGLRQATFECRLLLDTTLKKIDFLQLQTDKCIHILNRTYNNISERLILGIYVDDILSTYRMGIASWFHKELSIYFSITINLKISLFWEYKLITM